ncbi:hypothetical protein V8D89_010994, partial [Ganoderma adspersum]
MRYHSSRPVRSCRKTAEDAARAENKMGLLTKEAYTVLRTFSNQITRYPTKPQLVELLTKIQNIPGCEDCKIEKLRAYFKERRKTEARARMAAKFKAGRRAEPDSVVVEIIEVDLQVASPPTSPASDSASADPDPPPPSPPSLPNPHLHLPMPSHAVVPKSFVDLAKWLQEQNRRFMELVTI